MSTELLTIPEPRRRPCPPTEVDFGILPDPELAFFGNVQDQQKGQRPVERHRHRSAIDSCECDRVRMSSASMSIMGLIRLSRDFLKHRGTPTELFNIKEPSY